MKVYCPTPIQTHEWFMWAYGVTYGSGGRCVKWRCNLTRVRLESNVYDQNDHISIVQNAIKVGSMSTFKYKNSLPSVKCLIPCWILNSRRCKGLKLGSCSCIWGISPSQCSFDVCRNQAIGAEGEQWRHWELSDVATADWPLQTGAGAATQVPYRNLCYPHSAQFYLLPFSLPGKLLLKPLFGYSLHPGCSFLRLISSQRNKK